MMKFLLFVIFAVAASAVQSEAYQGSRPRPPPVPVQDPYHYLHTHPDPAPFPTYSRPPQTTFSCQGRMHRSYADLEAYCQAYHLCRHQQLIMTRLCSNGTLFNDQTQACEHYYLVRCPKPSTNTNDV